MARVEKTVFISYRRTDVYTALAVYENLKNQGYDVFFDYRSISSGDFEQIITGNIKARAHFLLILTPTALDRCNEPGDWLRREIEFAIDERRNIIPLFFRGFRFGDPTVSEKLTGKLKNLSRYNGLNVHEDYFDEAMQRLRTQFLNKPLNTVLHPISTEVLKAVREEQVAADKALEQIENVQELVKDPAREMGTPKKFPPRRKPASPGQKTYYDSTSWKSLISKINWRRAGWAVIFFLFVAAGIVITSSWRAGLSPHIGSTITGKDGMTLVYVPAGEFTMGSDKGASDEKPAHKVTLDAFWIDQTEVTNAMYAKCVQDGNCQPPDVYQSSTRESYYDNSAFGSYPVIYVSREDAKAYCEWTNRRLPTEAEWEKAARGTDRRTYPWGNQAPNTNLLNYNNNVGDTTQVGKYPNGASPYGALDMAGNVWEWVADLYGETYYSSSPKSNPPGPDSGTTHIRRGGSWEDDEGGVHSAYRRADSTFSASKFIGFRCAVSQNRKAQTTPFTQITTELPSSTQTSQPANTDTPSPTVTSTSPTLSIGSTMISNKDGMTTLYVPAGNFAMGSKDYSFSQPVHTVYLDAFWIDKTEVTNEKYALCVSADTCDPPRDTDHFSNTGYANHPVFYVSWEDAKSYCAWAGRRLPTEAEWEKAARGTDGRIYPWGNEDPDSGLLNYNREIGETTEAGNYPNGVSPYGAVDMAGNVWEWVADWYDSNYYSHSPSSNPLGPNSGRFGVLRGGAWTSNANYQVGSAFRESVDLSNANSVIGFRCAMSATP